MLDVADSTTRVCQTCGVEKPLTSFHKVKQWLLRDCGPCCYIKNHAAIVRRRKRYYQKNRDKIIAKVMQRHHEKWPEIYAKHKEVRKQRTREYYHGTLKPGNLEVYGSVNSPERVEKNYEYRGRNRELYGTGYTPRGRLRRQERYLLLRLRVMGYYGGKCECCGENRYDQLNIDHIKGRADEIGKTGVYLTYDAIREYDENGYPNDRYRLLCWNCNMARGFYGYCPHNDGAADNEYSGKEVKLEMIIAYGGSCVLCGESKWEFLTIDHVNGGGNEHRRQNGISGGVNFYRRLRKQGWPTGEYRLLCFGCNCSTYHNAVRQRVAGGTVRFPN